MCTSLYLSSDPPVYNVHTVAVSEQTIEVNKKMPRAASLVPIGEGDIIKAFYLRETIPLMKSDEGNKDSIRPSATTFFWEIQQTCGLCSAY